MQISITTDCQEEAKIFLNAVEKSTAIQELRQKLRYKLKDIDFGEHQNYIEELYKELCEIDAIGE